MADTAQDTIGECERGMFGVHGILTDAWGQGFMVGSIVILLGLTIMNMRRKTMLHKLVLTELLLASLHGTFIFVEDGAFGWYLSSTAVALYISYNLHNIINWMKVKPLLSRWGSRIYIATVVLAIPFWIAEIYLNFAYNNHLGNDAFRQIRPWEALFREHFAVFPECAGRNPYWKLALTFKFMADVAFLDDFKTVLDNLTARATRDLICPLPDGPNIAGQTGCDVEEISVTHIEDQLEYGSLNPPQSAHLN
ncbi:hypothetical protein BJX62DRAFT_245786 [Aspergillus germanicus]